MVKLPGKVVKLINIIVENVEVYGYVPFSWNSISLKSELSVAKSVALSAKSLLSTYGSRLVNTDLTVLADANLQAEVNSLVAKMFKSNVVSQLFVPLFTGSVKAVSMHAISEEFTFEITADDITVTVKGTTSQLVDIDKSDIVAKVDMNAYETLESGSLSALVSITIQGDNDVTLKKQEPIYVTVNVKAK